MREGVQLKHVIVVFVIVRIDARVEVAPATQPAPAAAAPRAAPGRCPLDLGERVREPVEAVVQLFGAVAVFVCLAAGGQLALGFLTHFLNLVGHTLGYLLQVFFLLQKGDKHIFRISVEFGLFCDSFKLRAMSEMEL